MNALLRLCGCLLLGVVSTSALHADTFNFSFTGDNSVIGIPGVPFSGSGQLVAGEIGSSDRYLITSVSGTTMGQAITGLVGVNGFLFNDNILIFPAGAATGRFDALGVSYSLANGVLANLFSTNVTGSGQVLLGFSSSLVAETQFAPITITPASSAVPEPGTLMLLGTGVLGLAGGVRRRFFA